MAMAQRWVKRIRAEDAQGLATLQDIGGLQVAHSAGLLWVRGEIWNESIDRRIRSLPGEQFWLDPAERLIPFGCHLPVERLRPLDWQPLRDEIRIRLPPMRVAPPRSTQTEPHAGQRIELRLQRGNDVQTPNLLVATIDDWHAFVIEAPLVRFEKLAFACNRAGRVVVRGKVVPPLPGVRFVERDRVAVPAGYRWAPPVDADTVRRAFGVGDDDLLLWSSQEQAERAPGVAFIQTTRSGVRATYAALRRHANE